MTASGPELKNAIVVAEDLPVGLAVNAAGVLAVTLGVRVNDLLGGDVADADGVLHPGIIYRPLPVLRAGMAAIARIVHAASEDDELFCAAFSSLAQSCKTYDEYAHRLSETPTDAVHAVAVALVGPKKKVNKLVGSLPLLRAGRSEPATVPLVDRLFVPIGVRLPERLLLVHGQSGQCA